MELVLVIGTTPSVVKTCLVSRAKGLVVHPGNTPPMKRLLIHGDPGVRKDDEIEVDEERYVCFSVTRNGEWHGPTRPQLWCVIGTEDERELFERQRYIPHFLDTFAVDADEVTVA